MNWTLERIKEAASRAGARWEYPAGLIHDEFLILEREGRRLLVQRTRSPFLSAVALKISTDKLVSGALLSAAGLPVPPRLACAAVGPAERAFLRRHGAVAVKPNREDRGLGVAVGVRDAATLDEAVRRASRYRGPVVLEPHLPWRDLRVLVIGGSAVAAYERRPPSAVGDGRRTVRGLIRRLNSDPRRGVLSEGALLARASAGPAARTALAAQGFSLDSVPKAGRRVWLGGPANISLGGDAVDRTEDAHPSYSAAAVAAADVLEVDVAGVDFLVKDPSAPFRGGEDGVVLEVNSMPGVRGFLAPSEGHPRPVLDEFVRYLFRRAAAREGLR